MWKHSQNLKDLEQALGGVSKSILCSLAAAQTQALQGQSTQVTLSSFSPPTSSSPGRACGCDRSLWGSGSREGRQDSQQRLQAAKGQRTWMLGSPGLYSDEAAASSSQGQVFCAEERHHRLQESLSWFWCITGTLLLLLELLFIIMACPPHQRVPQQWANTFVLHWKPHQKEIKAAQGGLQDCMLSK